MGQMLALLAALFLAVNPHPLHAHADGGTGHGHFGFFCDVLDTDMSPSDSEDGIPASHGDCIHHFDPLVRAPAEFGTLSVSVSVTATHIESGRQQILGFDPPPPRSVS